MKMKLLTLVALLGLVLAGNARADQIRLKSGELLQGEVLGDKTNEVSLTIRLYRTGGEFQLPWDSLIQEDQDRIRQDFGLEPIDIEAIPKVPGNRVYLTSGAQVVGLAENPEGTAALVLKTATGKREYPRSMVAKVVAEPVDALEVYTPEELAARAKEEIQPETPAAYVELGDRCMQYTAYEAAKAAYDQALADPEFAGSERAQTLKNRIRRADILIRAKDATDRVQDIKLLVFHDRFDDAIAALDKLAADYSGSPDILNELNLDSLKRQIEKDRRNHFTGEVRRLFFRDMDQLISDKVREKDATLQSVLQWAQNSRGLGHDIFAKIAEDTGLTEAEAFQFWQERNSRQVHQYSYGTGTFMNREVAGKVQKALALARAAAAKAAAANRTRTRNRNNVPKSSPAAKPDRPITPDEWWKNSSPSDHERLVKAWFAEYGGMLKVISFKTRPCKECGGKGVKIAHDTSGEEIRTICHQCNLAGHERIVVCR